MKPAERRHFRVRRCSWAVVGDKADKAVRSIWFENRQSWMEYP